tara:strand:- start:101 stop:1318 length:1218 start_codon:yes stop_codon:yes gene_type:complete
MVIEITDKRIISFFEQRPEMDVEGTILKFIDIMDTLNENMNKTLTNSTVTEILNSIKCLRSDNKTILSAVMVEVMRGLKDDIRMIMSNSMNEKLEPTLREKLKEQQSNLVDNFSYKLEHILENKISVLKESATANREIISTQNDSLNMLLKRFENSSKKGKISENLLSNVLSDAFPLAEIQDVGKTKETGDIIMLRKNKAKILIENKDWTRPIVNAEVQKFIRDVEIQKCHGLFLSQNVGICSKDNYEIDILEGNLVTVYIHNVNYDEEKIRVGVDIIDNISEILKEIDILEINKSTEYGISKELTQFINVEYQNYLSHKDKTIRMAKDFVANLIKHEEEFNFSSLEKFLESKCNIQNNKNVCKYCGYIGKKAQSLSAHMRGCTKYKETLKRDKSENNEICIVTD